MCFFYEPERRLRSWPVTYPDDWDYKTKPQIPIHLIVFHCSHKPYCSPLHVNKTIFFLQVGVHSNANVLHFSKCTANICPCGATCLSSFWYIHVILQGYRQHYHENKEIMQIYSIQVLLLSCNGFCSILKMATFTFYVTINIFSASHKRLFFTKKIKNPETRGLFQFSDVCLHLVSSEWTAG